MCELSFPRLPGSSRRVRPRRDPAPAPDANNGDALMACRVDDGFSRASPRIASDGGLFIARLAARYRFGATHTLAANCRELAGNTFGAPADADHMRRAKSIRKSRIVPQRGQRLRIVGTQRFTAENTSAHIDLMPLRCPPINAQRPSATFQDRGFCRESRRNSPSRLDTRRIPHVV